MDMNRNTIWKNSANAPVKGEARATKFTSSVVGAVAPKVSEAEIERACRKPAENLDAYDSFLRG
jgi:hypothetical protein